MKKRILCGAASVLLLASCEPSHTVVTTQEEKTVISFSWWGNDDRNEYTLEAVDRFERLNPDIDVRCSYTEWSGYQVRNDVRMASGTEADVMQINFAWIEQYSPDGLGFYDLNKLSYIVSIDTIDPQMVEYGMRGGHLNALPIAMNAQTVYINRSAYERFGLDVPRTWDDLFAAAKVMNGECYPISMIEKSAWLYCIAYAEQTTGRKIISPEGKLEFTADDFQIMIDFYCRLINEKVMPNVEYAGDYDLEDDVTAGVVAWLSDAENECANAISLGWDVTAAEYTAAEGTPVGTGWYMKPATMYAISHSTAHPEEAARLLDFLLNSPVMAKLQGVEKGIPLSEPARRTLEEAGMLNGIQYQAFLRMQEVDTLSSINPKMENSSVITAFREACNEVLFEKSTSHEQAVLLYDKISEAWK